MTEDWLGSYMNVIGHDTPCPQVISIKLEMQNRALYNFCELVMPKEARPRIQLRLRLCGNLCQREILLDLFPLWCRRPRLRS